MTKQPFQFAIVGLGPRGHHALECLLAALIDAKKTSNVTLVGFEPTRHKGHGPVYDCEQLQSNWINITERVLVVLGRPAMQFGAVKIPAFPSYHAWAGLDFESWPEDRIDTFPPRSKIGEYLAERFETLSKPLIFENILEVINDRVDGLVSVDDKWGVQTESGEVVFADDILLTIGHQRTEADEQLKGWDEQARDNTNVCLHTEPYPVERIVTDTMGRTGPNVAIRGYGLATIDVARALAESFGKFRITDKLTRAHTYDLSDGARLEMAPFSLNGLCLGPKPLSPKLDAQYAPTQSELDALEKSLADRDAQALAKDENFLLNAICPIIARVYLDINEVEGDTPSDSGEVTHLIRRWIDDPFHAHECILDVSQPPAVVLDSLIGMAVGSKPITLDYCIGQVWRQCQMIIYGALSHGALPDQALAKMIFVDETLKRYSYGPPVESLQQLKALVEAGVLNLNTLDNPTIELDGSGWTLVSDNAEFKASVMVNAILDPPKIAGVQSSLLTSLLDDGVLLPVHDELGVSTSEDGLIIPAQDQKAVPIALMGRLAKGTVIGVDAILECFGDRSESWAAGAVTRAAIK